MKITDLPTATSLTGAETVPISIGSQNKKMLLSTIIGASSGSSTTFGPTSFTVNEQVPDNTLIGTLVVPTGFYATLVPGWSQNGRVKLTGDQFQEIRATASPFYYVSNPSPVIRVAITSYSGIIETVEENITINLISQASSGISSDIDLDTVRNVEIGSTFVANSIDSSLFTTHGLPVNGPGIEFITPRSMSTALSPLFNGGGTTSAPGPTINGFATCDINNLGFADGGRHVITTRALTTNESVVISIKFNGNGTNGQGYQMAAYVGGVPIAVASSGSDINAVPTFTSGCTVIRRDVDADGQTLHLLTTSPSNNSMEVRVATYTTGIIRLFGLQVSVGIAPHPFVATGSTGTTTPGNAPVAGGALDTLLKGSTWWLRLEFGKVASGFPSNLLGHGTSGSTTIVKSTGRTHITGLSDDSLLACFGLGGFNGVSIITIANTPSLSYWCVNDGEVVTGPSLTLSGAITVGSNANTTLRRIEAGHVALTSTQTKFLSCLLERDYPDLDNNTVGSPAVYGRNAGLVCNIDMSTGTMATRPSGQERSPTDTYGNRAASFVGGDLIDGYQYYSNGVCTGRQGDVINSEEQDYVFSSAFQLGDSGGYLGAIKAGQTRPGALPGKVLVLTAQLFSSLPSQAKTILNAAWGGAGEPQKYISGCATTLGRHDWGINSVCSARIKTCDVPHCWDTWWLEDTPGFAGSEVDIFERPLQGAGSERLCRPGAHWNAYGANFSYTNYDLGVSTSSDWTNQDWIWLSGGRAIWVVCGEITSVQDLGGSFAVESTRMFGLINNAIGGNYPGATDSGTDAALATPQEQLWNHISAWQLAVPAPVLSTLTLSSGNLSGKTPNSVLSIVSCSTGTATLSGLALSGPSGAVVQVLETLPVAIVPQVVSSITIP